MLLYGGGDVRRRTSLTFLLLDPRTPSILIVRPEPPLTMLTYRGYALLAKSGSRRAYASPAWRGSLPARGARRLARRIQRWCRPMAKWLNRPGLLVRCCSPRRLPLPNAPNNRRADERVRKPRRTVCGLRAALSSENIHLVSTRPRRIHDPAASFAVGGRVRSSWRVPPRRVTMAVKSASGAGLSTLAMVSRVASVRVDTPVAPPTLPGGTTLGVLPLRDVPLAVAGWCLGSRYASGSGIQLLVCWKVPRAGPSLAPGNPRVPLRRGFLRD